MRIMVSYFIPSCPECKLECRSCVRQLHIQHLSGNKKKISIMLESVHLTINKLQVNVLNSLRTNSQLDEISLFAGGKKMNT